MKWLFEICLLFIFVGILSFAGCRSTKQSGAALPSAASPDVFEKTIRPVLEHRCIHCHNDTKPNAGLNFQDHTALFTQTKMGRFLDPGRPETSRIYMAILKPQTHPGAMPADGWGIDLYDLHAFRAWIEDGAQWPEGDEGQLEVKEYQVRPGGHR